MIDFDADSLSNLRTAPEFRRQSRRRFASEPQPALRQVLLAQEARRHSFEAVEELRERNPGRAVHKQVNAIVVAVKLNELRLKVPADGGFMDRLMLGPPASPTEFETEVRRLCLLFSGTEF
jgi:hypothetical protein